MPALPGRPPCRAFVMTSLVAGLTLAVSGAAEPCGRIVPGDAP
ncbi:hypothetical protein [Belnapia rosea]|nr:hypothetical protein [Belnapia rosea]SDB68775.1 hypothetical protein SAMN02927895_03283 [Belnapia rosea]